MCWSGEASAVLATVGLGTTIWAAYKKEPMPLWICLGYFSLMELLQAYTYSVIDQCDHPGNQIATLFGYLHIAFQPFFINMMAMYFIPDRIRRKIAPAIYTLCFASAIFMIVQVYPFDWAGQCNPADRPLCGERLCSVSGNWHIAWEVPANGIGNSCTGRPFFGYPTYVIVGMMLPFLYGSWRFGLYHYALGPVLAASLTDNINEWPAIWCLLSIGILLIVVKTPLRKYMFVKSWWLWRKPKKAS